MSFFPFYVDLEGREGLIIGGGKIALHKIKKLLPFGVKLNVVAREALQEIKDLENINMEIREFREEDVENQFFVVAATSDEKFNTYIYNLCTSRNILVNVVDVNDRCNFIFPAIVKKGNFCASVSTGGASPRVTTLVTEIIKDNIPDNIDEILDYLESLRPVAKAEISDEKERARYLIEKAEEAFYKGLGGK